MKFLFWSIVVVLLLALVNAIARWFGLDVAEAAESPDPPRAHGVSEHPAHPAAAVPAAHAAHH